MIIGSHNSMSYYTPQWWMIPFAWAARCQDLNIDEQYAAGCRLFDLRVKFGKNGVPFFAHGLAHYKSASVFGTLHALNYKANTCTDPLWVRILLEEDKHEEEFISFCRSIESMYPHLRFFGGWKAHVGQSELIYKFSGVEPVVVGKYSSDNGDIPGKSVTGYWWDDLYPRLYAKKNNAKNRLLYMGQDIYLHQDFVGVY